MKILSKVCKWKVITVLLLSVTFSNAYEEDESSKKKDPDVYFDKTEPFENYAIIEGVKKRRQKTQENNAGEILKNQDDSDDGLVLQVDENYQIPKLFNDDED